MFDHLILKNEDLRRLLELDDNVIDILEKDGEIIPVVKAYTDGDSNIKFWCIHCRKWHLHRRNSLEISNAGIKPNIYCGLALCTTENSPFKQNRIMLSVVGKYPQDVIENHRDKYSLICPACTKPYSEAFNLCYCPPVPGKKKIYYMNIKRKREYPKISDAYKDILEKNMGACDMNVNSQRVL